MTPEQQKEQFSIAWVRAIAAVAGVRIDRPEIDDDSIDLRFSVKSIAGSAVAPMVEAQLKCTSDNALKADGLHFELKLKNYEELRGWRYVPRVLIVLVIPPVVENWMRLSPDQLILRGAAYWYSLKDEAETQNRASVTLTIPGSQAFTVPAIRTLLNLDATP